MQTSAADNAPLPGSGSGAGSGAAGSQTKPSGTTALSPDHDVETLCFIHEHAYRLLWWFILVVYFIVALQLVLLGGFYFFIMGIPAVAYYMDMFHLIPVSEFPLVVAVYGITALLIYREIFRILLLSLRLRRLSLIDEAAFNAAATRTAHVAKSLRKSKTLASKLRRVWMGYFRIISVRGPFFEIVMLTRELVEIVVQVSQAYQSSRFTPNLSLNVGFGALILVNCVSSPVLERSTRAGVGRLRMNILLMDLFLDLVWLVLPLALFPHYIMGFFGGLSIMYEDTFMVRAFMETQIMFVTSRMDLFSKILPSLSIYFTIRKLRVLVRRRERSSSTSSRSVLSVASTRNIVIPVVSPASQLLAAAKKTSSKLLKAATMRSTRVRNPNNHQVGFVPRHMRYVHLLERILVRVLLGLGAFTLVVNVLTVVLRGKCADGCKLVLHPWFEYSRCRCAVQEISCHARGIDGSEDQLRLAFTTMERVGLQSLILSHCPTLQIPTEIREFHDLYGLEIYNSSIASWPAAASLSGDVFPRLSFVYLLRTHLTELPDGLLQDDLPASLLEIDVIVSNLTTLPDDLDQKWRGVRNVYLDHGQLSAVPAVLGRMPLESLSLYNNSIHVIPNDTFATSTLKYLLLNGNPLTQLPATLGNLEQFYELQIQQTNITELSGEWTTSPSLQPNFRVFARSSPLCAGHDAPDESEPISPNLASVSAFVVRAGALLVNCDVRVSVYANQRSLAYFALEGKTLDRAIVKGLPLLYS